MLFKGHWPVQYTCQPIIIHLGERSFRQISSDQCGPPMAIVGRSLHVVMWWLIIPARRLKFKCGLARVPSVSLKSETDQQINHRSILDPPHTNICANFGDFPLLLFLPHRFQVETFNPPFRYYLLFGQSLLHRVPRAAALTTLSSVKQVSIDISSSLVMAMAGLVNEWKCSW